MENFLETLKTTAESAEVQREKKIREMREEESQKDREMILEITESLKSKLLKEAEMGNHNYTVLEASVHGSYMNRKVAFYDYGRCWRSIGNPFENRSKFYESRNDEKMIQKVISESQGVFRAVYDYCKKEGLNPIVKYFDDGVGQTYGYGIYISW